MTTKRELTIKLNHVILIAGFQKVSMSKLASLINVSRATLYIYFKDKDDVVNAVVDRHIEFISTHQIPKTFKSEDFLPVQLNSLLLLGSTTKTFNDELKVAYPELFQKMNSAYEKYFSDLEKYYSAAIKAGFIMSSYSSDFIIFQDRNNIQGILDAVLAKELTVNQAEDFLNQYMVFQIGGLINQSAQEELDPSIIEDFKKQIFAEFRATYSLLA
jgi:AcrR family transcriptional regulator